MLLAYATVTGYQIGVPAQPPGVDLLGVFIVVILSLKIHVSCPLLFGSPQVWRERIFFLAYRKGCNFFEAQAVMWSHAKVYTKHSVKPIRP